MTDTDRETVGAALALFRDARQWIMHPDCADAIELACALLEPIARGEDPDAAEVDDGFGETAPRDDREGYALYLDRLFTRCEYDTNGYMRSAAGVRAGYSSRRFFTDRRPRAAYASPELLDWMRANGPIMSYAEWRDGAVRPSGRKAWYESDTTRVERQTGRARSSAQRARDRRAIA